MSEIKKQEMTIQWIVHRKDKKVVKFVEGEDRTYKIAENVTGQIEEVKKRKTSVPVEVIITKGETADKDLVTYIALRGEQVDVEKTEEAKPEPLKEEKKEQSKEEKKNEETPTKVSSIKTVTVNYYSKDRLWWVFNETGEKTWLGIDDSLVEFMKGINKGDTLEISGESRKSKGRDVDFITSAKIVSKATVSSENSNEKETTKKSYGRDEASTDKRTALMVAKDIVVSYINAKAKIVETETHVGEMIKRLTKVCYEALQSI